MKCTVCAKEIAKSRYSHEILCSTECCAKDLWIRLSHRKDYFRIGNTCYSLGSFDEVWKDHTDRISYIRLPDQTIVETSNLWCHGELPEEFLSNFEEAHTLYKYYVDAPRGIRDYEKAHHQEKRRQRISESCSVKIQGEALHGKGAYPHPD